MDSPLKPLNELAEGENTLFRLECTPAVGLDGEEEWMLGKWGGPHEAELGFSTSDIRWPEQLLLTISSLRHQGSQEETLPSQVRRGRNTFGALHNLLAPWIPALELQEATSHTPVHTSVWCPHVFFIKPSDPYFPPESAISPRVFGIGSPQFVLVLHIFRRQLRHRESRFPKPVRGQCRLQTNTQGPKGLCTFFSHIDSCCWAYRPKMSNTRQIPGVPRLLSKPIDWCGNIVYVKWDFDGQLSWQRFPEFNSNVKGIRGNNYCISFSYHLFVHAVIHYKFTKDPVCRGTDLYTGNEVMRKKLQTNYLLFWRNFLFSSKESQRYNPHM